MQCPTIDALQESRTHEPELVASSTSRLMLAVLEEALVTFQKGLRSNDALQRHHCCEVDRWVASTDGDLLFSFENICSSLSIDPGYVRDGLKRIKIAARDGRGDDLAARRLLRREQIYDRRAWRGRIRLAG